MINIMKYRIFISGPMTGFPHYNFKNFNKWADYFKSKGLEVCNPVDVCHRFKLQDVLKYKTVFKKMVHEELEELKTCTHMFLLNGWEKSFGCRAEIKYCWKYDIKIICQSSLRNQNLDNLLLS